ncbi:MAG: pilus assembly protein PilP [Zoogloeaceae bacterium]|jgi:type IV pilus assembly protein PilP|nr:pilus assembly protein PilP [Zoogloeaceae bacterium]
MNRRLLSRALPVCLAAFLLSACGVDSVSDVEDWIREAEKDIKPSIPPIPKATPYFAVAYDAAGRLEPFDVNRLEPESKRRNGGANGLQPDFEKRELRNSLLEKYPLESMRLIGVMNINRQPMGVIEVDNIVRQVKVGDYIGLDFGLITGIADSELTLKEMVEDTDGTWTERANTLLLQTKEEGK